MKKNNIYIPWFSLIMFFILIIEVSVYAEVQKDKKSGYLIIGSGLEYLSYSEHEPETDTYTDTSLYNMVIKFEGVLRLSHIFVGIKGVLPVSPGEEKEEWERFGTIYQTNNLEYAWTRIDGNIGYRFYRWINPYMGLRWAKSKQERNDFILTEPVSGKAIEINKALFASAGLNGVLVSSPGWQLQYSVECFMPIFAITENSVLSGWKSSEKDGYTIGARAFAKYIYSPSVSFYFELSGERAYWEGSDWIDYSEGSAKWPENETIALSSILGIVWSF